MLLNTSPQLLADVTVIETGSRAGVRYCGRLLADLGAEVVRLVRPTDAFAAREPGYEAYLDRGKRVVGGSPADGLAGELAALPGRRTVVICDDDDRSFLAAARASRHVNPGLLLEVLSDYGLDGPLADTPATDFTLQAHGGLSAVHPTFDRPPVAAGAEMSELSAGVSAAVGLLSALLMHEAGAPRVDDAEADIDVSRFEAVIALAQYPWMWSEIDGGFPYQVPFNAVPGMERADDGWVCAVAVSEPQWKGFKALAQIPELDDPRFDSFTARNGLAAEVTALVRGFTTRHSVDELVELGNTARVPITPVSTSATIADAAPFATRDFFRPVEDGRTEPSSVFRVTDATDGCTNDSAAAGGPVVGTDPKQPLRGLRVIEFGTFQAGPLVGSALAALGADVVKVEAVQRPDLIRWGPVHPSVSRIWERSVGFLGANTGKRGITLDFTDHDSRELLAALVAGSDVVLDNFLPRVLDSVGFDYAGLSALKPGIVMIRMPAWGSSGAWRDRPGFTYSVNATAGLAELTGYPDASPLLTGTIIDPYAAMHSTAAALAAIRRQRISGAGCEVEVPLCDVAAHLSARTMTTIRDDVVPTRCGNRRDSAAPQGFYRTAENSWLAISVCGDDQWHAGRAAIGIDAADERFATHESRAVHAEDLDELVGAACARASAPDLINALLAVGVAAVELSTGVDAAGQPQLLARQRVTEIKHPVAGTLHHLAAPARIAAAPAAMPGRPAPLFGEHNREVLAELGVSEAVIERMYAEGKLGDSPWGLPI